LYRCRGGAEVKKRWWCRGSASEELSFSRGSAEVEQRCIGGADLQVCRCEVCKGAELHSWHRGCAGQLQSSYRAGRASAEQVQSRCRAGADSRPAPALLYLLYTISAGPEHLGSSTSAQPLINLCTFTCKATSAEPLYPLSTSALPLPPPLKTPQHSLHPLCTSAPLHLCTTTHH